LILFSFIASLIVFVGVGVWSMRAKRASAEDYLLASRSLKPWLAGLSAVATTNSGFMFTGWIGLTYTMGLSSMWFMWGLGSGTLLSLYTVGRRLRANSEARQALSYGELLANWSGDRQRWTQRVIGLTILVFLSTYAAAQLTAGGKALHVLFDWSYDAGAIIGAGVIVIYCFSGGIRASVWTDAAQSIAMIGAMGILFAVCLTEIGGFGALYRGLHSIDPALTAVFPQNTLFGPGLYIAGWFIGGWGVAGQPHIMVRFMGVNSAAGVSRSLNYYVAWYVLFFAMSFLVGLMSRLLLTEAAAFDAELALPTIALNLLPEALVGVILAGLFAASMSTADSLVLGASAALLRDLMDRRAIAYLHAKLSTLATAAFVLAAALWGGQNVFALVTFSWGAMAAAFGPLLFASMLGWRPRQAAAVAMVLTGMGAACLWRTYGLSSSVYEALPGMLAALLVFAVAIRLGAVERKSPDPTTEPSNPNEA